MMLLALSVAFAGAMPVALSDNKGQPVPASNSAQTPAPPPGSFMEDTLIVVLADNADNGEVQTAIKDLKGEIIKTTKMGDKTFLIVKTEKGKLAETEQKLLKDKSHFSLVQRNMMSRKQQCNLANDPAFPSQYELNQLRSPSGWCNGGTGQGVTVAIFDTGVNPVAELSGKLLAGYDAYRNIPNSGNHDTDPGTLGHGTACATTVAAVRNNGVATASPAYNTLIYPVIISDPSGSASDATVIQAISDAMSKNIKIISCSFNAVPPFHFANQAYHPALHVALQTYYNNGGIFFNAAGNERKTENTPLTQKLIVVVADDANKKLAKFSNKGTSTWFMAPGVLTQCTNKNGVKVSVSGTSFSTPLTAGVAAQVWSKYPGWTNVDVLNKMTTTTDKLFKGYNFSQMGFGIPNAQAATQ